jgi:hypothetical protein
VARHAIRDLNFLAMHWMTATLAVLADTLSVPALVTVQVDEDLTWA